MRVFKTKWFARFARKESIGDGRLADAVQEAECGLNDGDLGGHLVKKRVAREGQGKRGGYRTIIVYRKGKRSVFVYGFPKNAEDNISDVELKAFQKLGLHYLSFSDADIAKALQAGELKEVEYHG